MSRAICIYAKPPVPGRTKSRLAADIGDAPAAELAQAMLLDTCNAALALDANVELWYPPDAQEADFELPSGLTYRQQVGMDLGERMYHTFLQTFARAKQVLVLGSDCVTHSAASLGQAFDALRTAPLVFEPADDGGYVLIGQSSFSPIPFSPEVTWGTPEVMEITRHLLAEAKVPWHELPPTFDVDHQPDLRRMKAFASDHGRAHVQEWLAKYDQLI